MSQLYQVVFNCYIKGEYQEETINGLRLKILSSLREMEILWPESRQEQSGVRWVDENWEFLVRRLWSHISTMNHTAFDRQEDTFWQGLAPQLTELAQVTSISFDKLVQAVTLKEYKLILPDLEQACYAADQQIESLQNVERKNYPVGEMLRFASFFYNMEAVARDLIKMSDILRV